MDHQIVRGDQVVAHSVAQSPDLVQAVCVGDVEMVIRRVVIGLREDLSGEGRGDHSYPVVDPGQGAELRQNLCGEAVIGVDLCLTAFLDGGPEKCFHLFGQLGRRLVGECDSKDLLRVDTVVFYEVGDDEGDGRGLAGAGSGPYPDRVETHVEDRLLLWRRLERAHGR